MLPLNLAVNAVLVLLVLAVARWRRPLLAAPALLLAAPVAALPFGAGGHVVFPIASGLAWALFLWGPVLLILDARRRRPWAGPQRALAVGLLALGAWAFGVEPRRLDIHTEAVSAPALSTPLRVALVADIQTDRVDAHTEAAFAAVRAARPDLVLYAGDYLQLPAGPTFEAEAAKLRALVATLAPPLGSIAVRGDVDPDTWKASFVAPGGQGGVRLVDRTATFALGPLHVTALAPRDSRAADPGVPRTDGFHIVFGHAPDFVLANPPGDLFLAGHTHGGQVRIPGFGPLLTFSEVPREMASGLSHLPDGRPLYVSRGIGMERRDAPRLRFNCPPEVVILELAPGAPAHTDPSYTGRYG